MSSANGKQPPVVVNVVVELPIEEAFELFTRDMSSWWPLESHSVELEEATSVEFEVRQGGRIYEIGGSGEHHEWGEVLVCEPPRKIVFTWRPGRPAESQQTIEVFFEADGDLTHVELVHRDWEVFEDKADEMREGYTSGWARVIGECFVQGAEERRRTIVGSA